MCFLDMGLDSAWTCFMDKADRGDVNHLEDSPVSLWKHGNGSGCLDFLDKQTDIVNFPLTLWKCCHSPFSGISDGRIPHS